MGIDRVCGTNICSTDSKKYTRDNLGRGLCITGHLCGVHVHRPGRLSDGWKEEWSCSGLTTWQAAEGQVWEQEVSLVCQFIGEWKVCGGLSPQTCRIKCQCIEDTWGLLGTRNCIPKQRFQYLKRCIKGPGNKTSCLRIDLREFSWNTEYVTLEKMPVMRQFIPGSPEKPDKIDS